MELTLTSSAFEEGQPIPDANTRDADDASPPLTWTDPPEGTLSFALICDDPDAPRGPWVHWVLFNIPADVRILEEGLPARGTLADGGARQGRNDFGGVGYGGPSPPPGPAHRYFFKLYALDVMLDLPSGATKNQLEQQMKGHILARGQLIGKYGRARS